MLIRRYEGAGPIYRCIPEQTGPYRYTLEIRLCEELSLGTVGKRLAVILKNPSTASSTCSDPTVGKLEAWARRAGASSLLLVNLFARRATHPTALNELPYAAMVGLENDRYLRQAVAEADLVIAGWGNPNGIAPGLYACRSAEVLRLLAPMPVFVVGPLTRQGHPRHALLWNGGVALMRWR